jgi:hypothetical protein
MPSLKRANGHGDLPLAFRETIGWISGRARESGRAVGAAEGRRGMEAT